MQFSTVVSALLISAAAVSAAPATTAATAIQSVQDSAAAALKQLQAAGCNELKCIAALAGSTAACGAAAAQLGADPLQTSAALPLSEATLLASKTPSSYRIIRMFVKNVPWQAKAATKRASVPAKIPQEWLLSQVDLDL
ncbi:hypothetical protein VTN77DRAFT_967 [Rasamsonia byssochlamydoides]|uniref:uncharacterized protein n=1 Tax=Rasamsonia byssochlamydoides TaxID=89139 RepID=UPI0037444862